MSTSSNRRWPVARIAGLVSGLTVMAAPGRVSAQAVLRPGIVTQGELKSGDLKLDDDTYADLWRFSGSRGQSVRISMKAPDFDCYLQLGFYSDKREWVSVDSDDDGAGGTDSQIEQVLPRDGEYTVRANTLMVGETGSYTLTLETGMVTATAPSGATASADVLVSSRPGAHMPLVLGAWLRGTLGSGDETLSDGSPADIWVYQGRRGETLTMIQKSDVLDSYLTFGRVQDSGWRWEQADNNGAGGKDARLVVSLSADGEYWIRPNALFAGKGGYSLFVTSDRAGEGATPLAAPVATPPIEVQRAEIQIGQTIRGRLATGDALSFDTTYIDTYVFRGHGGDHVDIIMMSPDFGSYLLFGGEPADGASFSSMEHAGASAGRETRITVTVPKDGIYWIQANQFDRAEGSYVLTVEPAR